MYIVRLITNRRLTLTVLSTNLTHICLIKGSILYISWDQLREIMTLITGTYKSFCAAHLVKYS